jgi:hypothetical protein
VKTDAFIHRFHVAMTFLFFAPVGLVIYLCAIYIGLVRAIRDWNRPHLGCILEATHRYIHFLGRHGSPNTRVVEITKEQLMEMLKDQQP